MTFNSVGPHTRVNLVGVRHWCQHLAQLMESSDPDIEATVLRPRELVRHGRTGATVRVGYRPGARTWRGIAFDLLYAVSVPTRRRRTYWIGSDVIHALSDGRTGAIHRRWRSASGGRQAVGAPWFADELRTIGIEAEYLRFPHQPVSPKARSWPEDFAASVYIPVNNGEAYGSRLLPALADRTPDVPYRVYGGGFVEHRPNIVQVGYVEDPVTELERSVVHVRLTEHDGIAGTVREALAIGRYVVFGYEIPGVLCVDVRDLREIADAVQDLKQRFESTRLPPNDDGVRYADSMDADKDAAALVRWVTGR